MAFTKEVLDEILKSYSGNPEDFAGPGGLLKQLTKALLERAMEAELSHSLGYAKGEVGEKPTSNRRNGHTRKSLRTDHGPMEVSVPRDRLGDLSASFATLGYTRLARQSSVSIAKTLPLLTVLDCPPSFSPPRQSPSTAASGGALMTKSSQCMPLALPLARYRIT